jgi:phosphoserine phosphatase
MTALELLPSWRPGTSRDAVVRFLDAAAEIPPAERVAVFDNDGTLWCERPRYIQLDFFLAELVEAVSRRPELGDLPEYGALLSGDQSAVAELGLERIAIALVDLFTGLAPEQFDARVRHFFATARHPDFDVPYGHIVYQPMLELIDALRSRQFDVFLVTGGGTEFVRAVSNELYGVQPEGVIGSLVAYEIERMGSRPRLVRSNQLFGLVNDGEAKVANMQMALGRRPVLAAGNSHGDAMMLEYAMDADRPAIALLVDHDDDQREYAYASVADTFGSPEPITAAADRLGWTVASMRNDWNRIFPHGR